MATIPNSQKFHTLAGTVETENRGSAALNAQRTIYTMQDILDTVTVGGGVDGSGTAGKISKWIDANPSISQSSLMLFFMCSLASGWKGLNHW